MAAPLAQLPGSGLMRAADIRFSLTLMGVLNTWFNLLLILLSCIDSQQPRDYCWQKHIREAKDFILLICLLSMVGQTIGFIGLALFKPVLTRVHSAIVWLGGLLPCLLLLATLYPANPVLLLMSAHHLLIGVELVALQYFSKMLFQRGLEKVKAFLAKRLQKQQQQRQQQGEENQVFTLLPQSARGV